jgi:hypothetical protein
MRFVLFIFLVTLSFSASAQWWRIDQKFRKKQERPPVIEQVTDHSIARLHTETINHPKIQRVKLGPSDYSFEVAESIVMKEAQHNMRFRIYNDASYNFSELARLYVLQNRLSEAKWYLLQSNIISRQQNDDKHTISNLIDLALIKANIGDYILALDDLTEAHDLASLKGLTVYLAEIEKKMLYIKQNRPSSPKLVLRYAETPQNNNKTE